MATKTLMAQAAATAGDKASVQIGNEFMPGRKARVIFDARGQTGTAPAWAIDGSANNSSWTADIATSVVAEGSEAKEVTCYKYMRASVTTAAGTTAGTLSVRLENV